MPRRSSPSSLDPQRLHALLAAEVRGGDPARSGGPVYLGWVPEEAPHVEGVGGADLGWGDQGWADEVSDRDSEEPPPTGDGMPGDPSPLARVARPPGRHRPGPRVLTVPVSLRGARLAVSWRAVAAVFVLVVLAGAVFAVRVARAEQAAAPESVGTGGLTARTTVPEAFSSGAGAGAAESSGGSGASGSVPSSARGSPGAAASASAGASLVVDVVGQVSRPGVVTVPNGSRVADVLAAAGGTLPAADVRRLNLARLVSDGEQVFVPRPGEDPPTPVGILGGGGGGGGGGGASSAAGGSGGAGGSVGSGAPAGGGGTARAAPPVNLNTANLAELDTLPGVGPVLAQRILDWRGQHGRFSTVDELGEVSGIGDKLMEQIRPKVRV